MRPKRFDAVWEIWEFEDSGNPKRLHGSHHSKEDAIAHLRNITESNDNLSIVLAERFIYVGNP